MTNKSCVLTLAAVALAALAPGCSSPPSIVAQVKAPGNIDKLWILVRDNQAPGHPLVLSKVVEDASKGGTLRFDGDGVRITVDLAAPGQYGLILIGWSGSIDCLEHAASVFDGGLGSLGDGGAPGVGAGAQYFFARSVDVKDITSVDATLYTVDRKSGTPDDGDCDGFPGTSWKALSMASTASFYLDCNDGEPAQNPIAYELCGSGIDQNCDGTKAPDCGDLDGDGDPDRTDCNPMDPKVHHPDTDSKSAHYDPYPESPNCCGYSLGKGGTADASKSLADSPLCHASSCGDGIDYDCDGKPTPCRHDQDCDTFLASDKQAAGCSAAANAPAGNDCNDCDPKVNVLVAEVCDGKDNNCNGLVDETCISCDLDGDGYQRLDADRGCPDKDYPMGRTTDCNDDDAGVFPDSLMKAIPLEGLGARGVAVTCGGKDAPATVACALRRYCAVYDAKGRRAADCNGALPGCPDPACDADGDGFQPMRCSPPAALVDCDDNDASTFPGAPESCLPGRDAGVAVDHDCDGKVTSCASIRDSDGDGYADEWDCASNDAAVHPFALEVCDGVDNDCNGLVDEGNPDSLGKLMGTVALKNASECITAATGACGVMPYGHCICSGTSTQNLHFDGKRPPMLVCPTEPGNVEGRPGARCFFAQQPTNEICDGLDNSCSGGSDVTPADHLAAGSVIDCSGPVGQAKICCPPPGGMQGPPACKDPLADVENCGNCNQACSQKNGTPSCVKGMCTIACAPGFGECDKRADNGCEVSTLTDVDNCGSGGPMSAGCGMACSKKNVASRACAGGACTSVCLAGFADCNLDKLADGCEASTYDPRNCGLGGSKSDGRGPGAGCGCVCSSVHGSPLCSNGTCTAVCSAGYANCDGIVGDSCTGNMGNDCETPIDTDVKNCGGCGRQCSSQHVGIQLCVGGVCSGGCDMGFADCDKDKQGNGCETPTNSVDNCGPGGGAGQGAMAGCGCSCSKQRGTPACGNGQCSISCSPGFANCDGVVTNSCDNKPDNGCEITTGTDANNCGAGGANNAGCGCRCSTSSGTAACISGLCAITCDAGFANCDGVVGNTCGGNSSNGCEVFVQSDPNNCGAGGANNVGCGVKCVGAAGHIQVPTCTLGSCSGGCDVGWGDCNNNKQADGCETPVAGDVNNCGAGGQVNGGRGAAAGCGCVCANQNGIASCGGGKCTLTCQVGFANCDGVVGNSCSGNQGNGCEVNTLIDPNNCGPGGPGNAGCGNVCSLSNAVSGCAAGLCKVSACNANFGNCDLKDANGCESSLMTDPLNCKTCGVVCADPPNANKGCANGVCRIGSCLPGFADCNLQLGDGCEVSTQSSANNCGMCGKACPTPPNAAAGCFAGVCGTGQCNPNFQNCDGDGVNGCESNSLTDVKNCGICGNNCPVGPNAVSVACISGKCVATCNGSFLDCDLNAVNGCEVNGGTDKNNCSKCGNVCAVPNHASSVVCSAGICNIGACQAPWADCDLAPGDGCEINLNTNHANCGACFMACGGNFDCVVGGCVVQPLFAPMVSYPLNGGPNYMIQADINNDGLLDILTGYGFLGVSIGNANGTFKNAVEYTTLGNQTAGLAVGDWNGDGKIDVVAGTSGSQTLSWLAGKGDGTFNAAVQANAAPYVPGRVGAGDFNKDGFLDVVVADGTNNVVVFPGNGNGTFGPSKTPTPISKPSPLRLEVLDMNNDGNLDAVLSGTGRFVEIYMGNGDGTFKPPAAYPTNGASYAQDIKFGDLNGDGKRDILASSQTNTFQMLFGIGDGTFQPGVSVVVGVNTNVVAVAMGDYNADGRVDVACLDSSTNPGNVLVMVGNGDTTFTLPARLFPAATAPQLMVNGDYNSDGKPDLIVSNSNSRTLGVFLGQ